MSDGGCVLVNLLRVHVDLSLRHLHLYDDLVLLAEHLLVSQRRKADLGLAVVWVADHEEEVDEGARVLLIELADSIDGDLGDDGAHEVLHARLITWRDDLFSASLALFHTLRKQLQAERIEIIFQSRLPVDILHALVELRYLVDVEISLERLIK